MFETGAAEVPCLRLRHNPDLFSCRRETTAVVDVFEPSRPELLVERTDVVDNFATDQKRRRGRLIDTPRRRQIEIAIAVRSADRIRRPQFVDCQDFDSERFDGRKSAKLKFPLRVPPPIFEQWYRGSDIGMRSQKFDQHGERARRQLTIGIQQENERPTHRGDRPIDREDSEIAGFWKRREREGQVSREDRDPEPPSPKPSQGSPPSLAPRPRTWCRARSGPDARPAPPRR